MHIDARQVDLVGVKRPQRHDLFDLGDANLAAGGGRHVEVARRLAEHQVAGWVRLPCLDDRKIGNDPTFKDKGSAVKIVVFLAVCDHGAHPGRGVKARNAGPARPHPFGKRALGVELQLKLARKVLAHEFGILADIGRDHLADLPGFQKLAKAKAVHASVV